MFTWMVEQIIITLLMSYSSNVPRQFLKRYFNKGMYIFQLIHPEPRIYPSRETDHMKHFWIPSTILASLC